jgi:hypothetical protein
MVLGAFRLERVAVLPTTLAFTPWPMSASDHPANDLVDAKQERMIKFTKRDQRFYRPPLEARATCLRFREACALGRGALSR